MMKAQLIERERIKAVELCDGLGRGMISRNLVLRYHRSRLAYSAGGAKSYLFCFKLRRPNSVR
jgi:hypothetical protein